MKQTLAFVFIFSFILSNNMRAQKLCTPEDSIYIENLLNENIHAKTKNDYVFFYAKKLQGTPYASGTLDTCLNESLIINLHAFDCTTFVETVLALATTKQKGQKSTKDFAQTLQHIRYRNGVINGYASRLHYFSDWILNNIQKNIVKEMTQEYSIDRVPLHLYFMSKHSERYNALKDNLKAIEEIKKYENNITIDSIYYIPKNKLENIDLSWIKSGDIIAITTDRPGLDITHVGIAQNINGHIYLIHASLNARKVIIENVPLSKQLSKFKNQTGIRIIRPL